MTGDYQRTDRIAKHISRSLSEILLRESQDPRLRNVNITRVEVSADLAHAKVYYSLMQDVEGVDKALAKAAGFFRSQLAQRLKIRTTPQLKFIYDDTLDKVRRIQTLIKKDTRE